MIFLQRNDFQIIQISYNYKTFKNPVKIYALASLINGPFIYLSINEQSQKNIS
jgi:hypothetical protein